MKKAFLLLALVSLLSLVSCKRACYQCTQYCAYCISKADSSLAYKICATRFNGQTQVDSFRTAMQATNHYCNLLTDEKDFCAGKQVTDDALTYYQKLDYYCQPKE